MSLLAEMAVSSRARVDAAREPLADLRQRAADAPPVRPLRLERFDLIAEVKLRAPSAGRLARSEAPATLAALYAGAGAAAVSVLTEPTRFDGDLGHLQATAGCGAPVMRKDFLVDPYQVWEARAAGASGVLLIVRMLDDDGLAALADAAVEAGLFALVEAFDGEDLERAGAVVERWPRDAGPLLVGVNSRNLVTLEVDLGRLERLAARVPGVPVAESGLAAPDDAQAMARAGYRVALVGSALMRAPDPAGLVRSMIAAGRAACR